MAFCSLGVDVPVLQMEKLRLGEKKTGTSPKAQEMTVLGFELHFFCLPNTQALLGPGSSFKSQVCFPELWWPLGRSVLSPFLLNLSQLSAGIHVLAV